MARGEFEHEIERFDSVIRDLDGREDLESREQLALALWWKGRRSLEIGRKADAVASWMELDRRFAGAEETKLREYGRDAAAVAAASLIDLRQFRQAHHIFCRILGGWETDVGAFREMAAWLLVAASWFLRLLHLRWPLARAYGRLNSSAEVFTTVR